MATRKQTEVEQQLAFVQALFTNLVMNVNKHEEERLSRSWDYHATGEKQSYSKIPIQNDILKIRRELLTLSQMMEDFRYAK